MNIFKKLINIFKKDEKKEAQETWYNDKHNTYDPKTGTPNGEAYISPDSIVVGLSDSNMNS